MLAANMASPRLNDVVWKTIEEELKANHNQISYILHAKYDTPEKLKAFADQVDLYLSRFEVGEDLPKKQAMLMHAPGQEQEIDGYCKLSQLNFRQGASIKGNQKTCDVADKIGHFLKDGFMSNLEPIVLRFAFPSVQPGTPLENFNVNFTKGAQRSLAAMLIAEIAMTKGLQHTDMTEQEKKVMRSLCYIKVSCISQCTIKDLARNVVMLKQRGSETQRCDVLEYVKVFGLEATEVIKSRAAAGGNRAEHREVIIECIADFNRSTTVRNVKIDGDERQAVTNLCVYGEAVQKLCQEVWCSYKIRESPITAAFLKIDWLKKRPPADACSVWRAWMTPQAHLLPFFFQRVIITFNHKVNNVIATTGRAAPLRASGSKFREIPSEDTLWVCMVWANWQESLKAALTPAKLTDLNHMMFRGTLDDVILKFIQQNDPDFQASWGCFSFCFWSHANFHRSKTATCAPDPRT